MMTIWRDAIRAAVEEAKPYSFGDPQRITEWAELFVDAHRAAPGGLSLEIGTWRGGTALVFLRLLERLYPADRRPMLFTIDPYGDKPYNGGDEAARPALYGNADYVLMKRLLATFAHHAHFYMTSVQFFVRPPVFWWQGQPRTVDQLSFALIDGEHDAATIREDVQAVHRRMAAAGIVVVDNIDNDPATEAIVTQESRQVEVRQAALMRHDGERQRYAVLRPPPRMVAACQ